MGMSVLFREISSELNLNLVQVGLIWGIGSLLAIFTCLLSGTFIDRFGAKRILMAGTILIGSTIAMRGLATDFGSLLAVVLLNGSLMPLVVTSASKISGIWFPRRQLALANGIFSIGLASGLLLGSLLSATVLSPLLGGWRPVMFLFGALAAALSIPWYFTKPAPDQSGEAATPVPIREALSHIVRLKNIWLLGLAVMCLGGCIQGISGFLPIHLRGIGWSGAAADAASSLFILMSLIAILPVALLSTRLGSRRTTLLGTLLIMALGCGLLSATPGWVIFGGVVLAGMTRDSSMTLLLTMVIETEGVGPVYAGSATGLVMSFFYLGSLLSPPTGNWLAGIAPGLPFLFWAGLAVLGIASLSFIKSREAAG
jgi:MFS family permease